jgi:hypothetical protein
VTYYFTVKAVNGASPTHLESSAANSNGQFVKGVNSTPKLKVYPNPFKAGQSMKFTNLVSKSSLKIYTLSGKLIRSLTESGGEASWDGKNTDRQSIAPGLYIYVIIDKQGTKKTGKIAISK